MVSALVLDGCTLSALSIVRSLGRLGHRVLVASPEPSSIAGQSRYSTSQLVSPQVLTDVEAYVRWIAKTVEEQSVEHLFWTTTATTLALDHFRGYLSPAHLGDLPSSEVITRAYDKAETFRLAREVGIPVPATWSFQHLDELRAEAKNVAQPCVIKPGQSYSLVGNQLIRNGRHRYATDECLLIEAFAILHTEVSKPLVQEYIPGYGFGVFLLMQDQEPVAAFAHRRVREADPTGSGGCFRVSIELPPDAYEYSVRLLQAMKWRGVAMVEFKRDARDGLPKIMEVNGRFWYSLALCIRAGVDFPRLLLEMKSGRQLSRAPIPYRCGVGSHWLGGEAMHLLKVLKGKPVGYPGSYPGRLETLVGMARDFLFHPHIDTFQTTDPRPALFELWLLSRGIV